MNTLFNLTLSASGILISLLGVGILLHRWYETSHTNKWLLLVNVVMVIVNGSLFISSLKGL